GRFALGFDKDVTDLGLPMAAFGHSGWGGANGFADPSSRLAFGYAMNRMNYTDRWEPLARAAYRTLGYREGRYGVWLRWARFLRAGPRVEIQARVQRPA